jgi:hypothetical protein
VTSEEVAAVTAVTLLLQEQRVEAAPAQPADQLDQWVHASRRSAQRALLQRGPWRLSGRIGRRSRI